MVLPRDELVRGVGTDRVAPEAATVGRVRATVVDQRVVRRENAAVRTPKHWQLLRNALQRHTLLLSGYDSW